MIKELFIKHNHPTFIGPTYNYKTKGITKETENSNFGNLVTTFLFFFFIFCFIWNKKKVGFHLSK